MEEEVFLIIVKKNHFTSNTSDLGPTSVCHLVISIPMYHNNNMAEYVFLMVHKQIGISWVRYGTTCTLAGKVKGWVHIVVQLQLLGWVDARLKISGSP